MSRARTGSDLPPNSNLSKATVMKWLREMARNPLTDEEIEAVDDRTVTVDPAVALNLEKDGTPAWWPKSHPNVDRPLSQAERLRWAADVLAGEWSLRKRALLGATRRQVIARSLLQVLPRMSEGDLPTPDL
jgi:hypothetical protein